MYTLFILLKPYTHFFILLIIMLQRYGSNIGDDGGDNDFHLQVA